MLMPRASTGGFFDRYLLPLMALLLLVLARYYQERVRPKLPTLSAVFITIVACFTIVGIHDMFAMYRGYLAAFQQVRSSGVPATAISGSWENDGWTELETVGYINESRVRIPRDAYVYQPVTFFPAGCDGNPLDRIPAVKPIYRLSHVATPAHQLYLYREVSGHTGPLITVVRRSAMRMFPGLQALQQFARKVEGLRGPLRLHIAHNLIHDATPDAQA
jgi:hypothetical protein